MSGPGAGSSTQAHESAPCQRGDRAACGAPLHLTQDRWQRRVVPQIERDDSFATPCISFKQEGGKTGLRAKRCYVTRRFINPSLGFCWSRTNPLIHGYLLIGPIYLSKAQPLIVRWALKICITENKWLIALLSCSCLFFSVLQRLLAFVLKEQNDALSSPVCYCFPQICNLSWHIVHVTANPVNTGFLV